MPDLDRAVEFLDFVRERHRVWEKRQAGEPQPWTDDPILATRKFTNVFRAIDPGSQFVLTDLLEEDPQTFLLRCFLYRHTGRVEAWRAGFLEFGDYPDALTLPDWGAFWKDYRAETGTFFTGAYLVFPQSQVPGTDKIDSVISLTQRLWENGSFRDFVQAETQSERFTALRRNRGVADFMSMQVLTDYGYSTEFRENDFVVPGPGARKGAGVLDSKAEPSDTLEWAFQAVLRMDDPPLWEGAYPSRMDVQNCLCEYSKYVLRYQSKRSPERLYAPAHPGVQLAPAVPPLWDRI